MSDKVCIIAIVLVLAMTFCVSCKEAFNSWKEATISKGYPVPQGKLSNFKYGDTTKFQDESEENWNDILNTNGIRENFVAPAPRTVLGHN